MEDNNYVNDGRSGQCIFSLAPEYDKSWVEYLVWFGFRYWTIVYGFGQLW